MNVFSYFGEFQIPPGVNSNFILPQVNFKFPQRKLELEFSPVGGRILISTGGIYINFISHECALLIWEISNSPGVNSNFIFPQVNFKFPQCKLELEFSPVEVEF